MGRNISIFGITDNGAKRIFQLRINYFNFYNHIHS